MKLPKRFTRSKRKKLRLDILQGRIQIDKIKFKDVTNSHELCPPDPEIFCGTVEEVAELFSKVAFADPVPTHIENGEGAVVGAYCSKCGDYLDIKGEFHYIYLYSLYDFICERCMEIAE